MTLLNFFHVAIPKGWILSVLLNTFPLITIAEYILTGNSNFIKSKNKSDLLQ